MTTAPYAERAPLVSIVIPCFNSERYVAQAVESALAQTHPAIEVIAIDDASSDRTLDVLRGFGERIRLETNGAALGPAAVRNRGVALARGEFVQFLDADDVLAPDKVRRCLQAFTDETDMVFCRNEYFLDHHRGRPLPLRTRLVKRLTGGMKWDPARAAEYVLRCEVQTATPLHRISVLRSIGGFHEGLWSLEDTELHFRSALHGARVHFIDEVLVHCRHHGSPHRLRLRKGRFTESFRALQLMRASLREFPRHDPDLDRALADRFANTARKLLWDGEPDLARRALAEALALSRRPRPTSVPLYNTLSRAVGFWRMERACMTVVNSIAGGMHSLAPGGDAREKPGVLK
jgi:glycosyltransferase involved in cell wall biosynthesis